MPQIYPLTFAQRYPTRLYTPYPPYSLAPVARPTPPIAVRPSLPPSAYRTVAALPVVTSIVVPRVLPTPKVLCQRYFVYDPEVRYIGPYPVVLEGSDYVVYMTSAQAAFHLSHSFGIGLVRWADLTLSRRKLFRQMFSRTTRVVPWLPPIIGTVVAAQNGTVSVALTPYQFPVGCFRDPDNDPYITFTYSALLANGAALPAWLTFVPATRTFSGTPTSAGVFTVRLTAIDQFGRIVYQDIVWTIATP